MPLIQTLSKKLEVVEEAGSTHDPNELPDIHLRPSNRDLMIDPLLTRNIHTSVNVTISATPAANLRPNSRLAAVSPLVASQMQISDQKW